MKKLAKKKSRIFKPGELKRLLGIPKPKDRQKNNSAYCRKVAALIENNLRAGKYDGRMGGLLRKKAVYYVGWYRWRAKNEPSREAA